MKRKLYFLAAFGAALALVGCVFEPDDAIAYSETTTDDSSDETKVSFLSSTSRAVVNDLSMLQGDKLGFGVYGVNSSDAGFFIDGDSYGYNDTSSSWGWLGDSYSWPTSTDSYPVEFYAFYPADDDAVDMASVDSNKSLTAAITIQSADSQTDLLAAVNSVDMRPVGGAISLSFDHILSQVNLNVKAGANSIVHLQSVTFKAMVGSNTFDYVAKSWKPFESVTYDENVLYSYVGIKKPATTITSTSSALVSDNGSLMLMPQTLVPWDTTSSGTAAGARVVIVYRVTDSDGGDVVGFSNADYSVGSGDVVNGPLFVKVGYPLEGEWVAGSSYSYVVELGGLESSGGYYISSSYFDDEGNETNLVVDEDIVPGDTVYDEEINFTVSVGEWVSDSDITID
ncbi:MAG: fimbrillin family protein [Rikenellaceae bacterium]